MQAKVAQKAALLGPLYGTMQSIHGQDEKRRRQGITLPDALRDADRVTPGPIDND